MCRTNDFFGERLVPTVNYVGGPPAQIVTTSDVNGDQWPDVVLSYGTLLSVILGTGNGEFAKRQDYTVWSEMTSPIATDLNKDGYLDVVVAFPEWNSVQVFMGQSNGIDDHTSSLSLPSLSSPQLVAAGDLDANGTVDLVVSDGTTNLNVLVGATVGYSFTAGSSIALQRPIGFLRVGDANDDKVPDLVTLGPAGGIGAYLGKGDGTFGPCVETAYTGTPKSLALGSFNGDGYLDLLTAEGSRMVKWLGKGDGLFRPFYNQVVAAVAAEIVDLDADGFNDVVAAETPSGRLCTFQGSADGTSWPNSWCPIVINNPNALGVADFDGDGTKDIVASSNTMPALVFSWGGPERRRTTDSGLQEFEMGTSIAALAVADLNADGMLDVVTAPISGSFLRFEWGAGSGQFPSSGSLDTDGPVRAMSIADFDNDGRLEIAAVTAKNTLVVVRPGPGLLTSLPTSVAYDLMAVADLNNDGRQDLVLAQKGATSGATLLGQGNATFGSERGFVSIRPIEDTAVGDLDRDGIPDLALATKPSVVEVSKGLGDGSFAKSNLFSGSNGLGSIKIADLNEDGIPDLVAGSDDAGASLLPGRGKMSFDYAIFVATGVPARDVVVADFDGDGHLDILASDLQSMALGLALGKGDGTFPKYVEFLAGVVPAKLAVGDLNRDGRLDLVMRRYATKFARLLNLCR